MTETFVHRIHLLNCLLGRQQILVPSHRQPAPFDIANMVSAACIHLPIALFYLTRYSLVNILGVVLPES
jgi:hypothetical protein